MKDRRRKLKRYATYHVCTKTNRDEIIFDKEISNLFLKTVARCRKKYSFRFQNFTVMGNHPHMMLTPGKNVPLPKIMQWINSVFAKAYNKKTGQSGHVWKERYFSVIIEMVEQFITTFEYLVMNPVKAKIVKEAKDYQPSGLYHYLHKMKTIDTEEAFIAKQYERCKDLPHKTSIST